MKYLYKMKNISHIQIDNFFIFANVNINILLYNK